MLVASLAVLAGLTVLAQPDSQNDSGNDGAPTTRPTPVLSLSFDSDGELAKETIVGKLNAKAEGPDLRSFQKRRQPTRRWNCRRNWRRTARFQGSRRRESLRLSRWATRLRSKPGCGPKSSEAARRCMSSARDGPGMTALRKIIRTGPCASRELRTARESASCFGASPTIRRQRPSITAGIPMAASPSTGAGTMWQ